MNNQYEKRLAEITAKRKRRNLIYKVIACIGCLVIGVTTFALMNPAITLEQQNDQAAMTASEETVNEISGEEQVETANEDISTYAAPDVFRSATPTTVETVSTAEFVELNLYDYNYNINNNWRSNQNYPGFQWNGGAYAYTKVSNSSADLGIADYYADRNTVDCIDFGNSMITNYDSSVTDGTKNGVAVGVGKLYDNSEASSTGKVNWLWYDGSDYGSITNRPVGLSTGYQSLANNLSDGYPALLTGESLAYLFTPGDAVTKQNTQSIDGLFQENELSGAMHFNSRLNHAQYSNNKFTVYNEVITPNFLLYPFGNFLPFNTITDSTKATQVGCFNREGGMKDYVEYTLADIDADLNASGGTAWQDTARKQLKLMLQEYAESWVYSPSGSVGWWNLTPEYALKDFFVGSGGPTDAVDFISQEHLDELYNIDWDVPTNFFYGMEMSMRLIQPKDGLTGHDNGDNDSAWVYTDFDGNASATPRKTGTPDGIPDYPMIFDFAGDDDVWVYVDDMLFLDLTGIHRHVGGRIDFATGKIYYFDLDLDTGDISQLPADAYKTYTFREMLEAAGKSDTYIDSVLNDKGTFNDYTAHTFKFYYLERGSGSSVCRINFNFPMLRQNTVSVTKELTADAAIEALGNPDFKFQIMKADSNGNKTEELFIGGNTAYKLYDKDGSEIAGEHKTDENGVFTLKAGQTAEFAGIKENAGKYYVRELLDEALKAQYEDIQVDGVTATSTQNIVIGRQGFRGLESTVHDASAGSHIFTFNNQITTKKLGDLKISKAVNAYGSDGEYGPFDMEVTLDGVKLPVGSKYKVGDATKTVTTAGIVTVGKDEIALIENIIAGTEFTVKETEDSADGYTVVYSGGSTGTDAAMATGTIAMETAVEVMVTNTQGGTALEIPVTKTVEDAHYGDYQHEFYMVQVTDPTGNEIAANGIEQTLTITQSNREDGTASFVLPYLKRGLTNGQKLYYRITETVAENRDPLMVYDDSVYIAEVTITKTTSEFSAAVTALYKNGETVEDFDVNGIKFNNKQLYKLEVSKIIDNNGTTGDTPDTEQEFEFTIKLKNGSDKLSDAEFPYAKGEATGSLKFDGEGEAVVKLKHGETLTLYNLPYNTTWQVIESAADGYLTEFNVNDTGAVKGKNTGEQQLTINTKIEFINSIASYKLPETGGIGTWPFIIGGILMIAGAAALIIRRRMDYGA